MPIVNAAGGEARRRPGRSSSTRRTGIPSTPRTSSTDGGIWPVHCVEDTHGAAFHPDLLVADHEVVRKGHDGRDGYSGFSVRDPLSGERGDTILHEMLTAAGRRATRDLRTRHRLLRRGDRPRRQDARAIRSRCSPMPCGPWSCSRATARRRSRACATPAPISSEPAPLSSGTAGSRRSCAGRS